MENNNIFESNTIIVASELTVMDQVSIGAEELNIKDGNLEEILNAYSSGND